MNRGFWAGDAIAQSMERAIVDVRRGDEAVAFYNQLKRIAAEREESMASNAANFAEKHALRAALAAFDPRHPLLTDKSLQERIQGAGKRTLAITRSWTNVAEAGRTFRLPEYSPPAPADTGGLRFLRASYAGALAELGALSTLLRRYLQAHPLLDSTKVKSEVQQAGIRAHQAKGDFGAATKAGERYKLD